MGVPTFGIPTFALPYVRPTFAVTMGVPTFAETRQVINEKIGTSKIAFHFIETSPEKYKRIQQLIAHEN
jgi:hypothetical protein